MFIMNISTTKSLRSYENDKFVKLYNIKKKYSIENILFDITCKALVRNGSAHLLTADAWVGGTVSAPQKFKLPSKLRHLMG